MCYGTKGNYYRSNSVPLRVTNNIIFALGTGIFSFTALVISEVTKAVTVKIKTTQGSKILCIKITSKHWQDEPTMVFSLAAC